MFCLITPAVQRTYHWTFGIGISTLQNIYSLFVTYVIDNSNILSYIFCLREIKSFIKNIYIFIQINLLMTFVNLNPQQYLITLCLLQICKNYLDNGILFRKLINGFSTLFKLRFNSSLNSFNESKVFGIYFTTILVRKDV